MFICVKCKSNFIKNRNDCCPIVFQNVINATDGFNFSIDYPNFRVKKYAFDFFISKYLIEPVQLSRGLWGNPNSYLKKRKIFQNLKELMQQDLLLEKDN